MTDPRTYTGAVKTFDRTDRTTGRPVVTRPSPEVSGLALVQRLAGNAATAALVGAVSSGAQTVVQRSATMELGSWNKDAQQGDTYELTVAANTDDMVGHAWIAVREQYGKGRDMSIGFWPDGWLGVLGSPVGGPGVLMAPDPHAGDDPKKHELHRRTETIPQERFLRVLDTVNSWEGASYNLLFHNCATFAKDVWLAGTANPDGIIADGDLHVWTPADEGNAIDAVNKARGLDPLGNPVKGQESSGAETAATGQAVA